MHEFKKTRVVTQRDIKGHVTKSPLKQGNQNPQNNMIASASFTSTAHVTQWSNDLTQKAEILSRRSNLTPQRVKNTVNDLSVVSVVPKSVST